MVCQGVDCPSTSGVLLECLNHEGRALFVHDDGAYFAALFVDGALVAVADRGASVGAAGLCLLAHSLHDFGREVA
jgi:hypothetical protein